MLRLTVAAVSTAVCYAAGDAEMLLSGPGGNILHLNKGEEPRANTGPGAGLVNEELEADVVIAGGGSAGFAAVLAAARNGVKTIIVHARKVLGGNASSESKLHMVGAGINGGRGKQFQCEAREGGIVEEMFLRNAVSNPQKASTLMDLTMYSMLKNEPNVKIILNSEVVSATKNGETITTVTAHSQLAQKSYTIKALTYIDATGDGRLGAEAFSPFIVGREAKSQYNESLALDKADNEVEGSSFAFTSVDNGVPMEFDPPSWIRKFNKSDFKYRGIGAIDYGYWWVEIAYPYNTVLDNNIIQDKLMENILGVWDYIKNSGNFPHAQNRSLDWIQWWPCKRQARRFIARYMMTQNDILPDISSKTHSPTLFHDRVSYGGWPFDLHNPKGIYDTSHPPNRATGLPFIYSTPLRSLIAQNVSNLFFAGRLAGFSQVVFGSQRVMKTCTTMGQAVGTAAAYCVKKGIQPEVLASAPADSPDIWSIQQQLIRDDAFVIGIYNSDPRDHVLKSNRIHATSTFNEGAVDGSPANIITGQSRAAGGKCAAPGQFKEGTNRWISEAIPAGITMEWDVAIPDVSLVEITFDTGMHRKLMLSMRAVDYNGQYWGPQPETVKDYTVEVLSGSKWHVAETITKNYLRKRVHDISSFIKSENIVVSALRINVTATNGFDKVSIPEIRMYCSGQDGPFPTKY